jgi:aldehyde dehydrogenase (NAD+)
VLFRAAALVERDADSLADDVVREVGKPITEARGEVARVAAILRFFAGEARRSGGQVLPSDGGDLTMTLREPVGVVGLITPWNFPLAIPAWKAAPALVAGNTLVLKAAEQAGVCAGRLAALLVEAGLPAGVLNLVLGEGEAGSALVDHADVDAISFTGSGAVGAAVRSACAGRGIRAQVEMGGKNAAVVLADAPLGRAAAMVAAGAFAFGGQKCTATGLCLVEAGVYDEFVDELERARLAIRTGDPRQDETVCGPLIDAAAVHRATGLGAAGRGDAGHYVDPALLVAADLTAPECVDELFAPVLPVVAVDDLGSAIEVMAALPTGLSASVHTEHAPSIRAFLRDAHAGVIAVNRATTGLEVQAPFGGLKASGSEHKEMGTGAVDFYTSLKTVYWAN